MSADVTYTRYFWDHTIFANEIFLLNETTN